MTTQRGVYTLLGGLLIALISTGSEALATIPYGGSGGVFPAFGPGVIAPPLVGGKEYSHDIDSTAAGGGAIGPPVADAEQIIAWDGSGGVVDASDFSGSRPLYLPDDPIDAIANRLDFGYHEVKSETAHLVFSVDDTFAGYSGGAPFPAMLPPGSPPGITLKNGNVIGGSGELSVELALSGGLNPADTQMLWAGQAAINGMPLPDDIDGTELWGPEPPESDTDKYSLDFDTLSFTPPGSVGPFSGDAVSVWNAPGTPYVPHSAVVFAVTSLLGAPSTAIPPVEEFINLDALMVQEAINTHPDGFDEFEASPTGGPGDEIIFSIRQIPDPGDPDGYYATGSELFVLNADGTFGFLMHGGHPWDHLYSLTTFEIFGGTSPQDPNYGVIDINAIEAVGEFAVPEPASIALLFVGLASIGCLGRQRS